MRLSSPELDVVKDTRAVSFGRGRLQCQCFFVQASLWEHAFTGFLIGGAGLCCLTSREVVRIGEHLRSICSTLPGTWEISGAFPSSTGGVRAAPDESFEKYLDGGANRPHLKRRFIPWKCQDVRPWATSVPSHGKTVLRVIRRAPNKKTP